MIKRACILLFVAAIASSAAACTSLLASGKATRSGRPLLWKNRDTGASNLDNFVGRVAATDSTHGYVALFNARDTALSEAWIGMNDAGFAIMNTASYNLTPCDKSYADREGLLMSEALRRCSSVADFAAMLDSLPKPLGVEANFGVIDCHGDGGYFETDDYTFTFFPIDDDHPVIVRTNFSVSGKTRGLGYERYDAAETLIDDAVKAADLTPELLTDTLSRSFYSTVSQKDMSSLPQLVDNGTYIPRFTTSASVAIEGIGEDGNADDMVMWTLLGYPPCGVTEPVTFGHVDERLLPDDKGFARYSDELRAAKKALFKPGKGTRNRVILMKALRKVNEANRKASLENYRRYRESKGSAAK